MKLFFSELSEEYKDELTLYKISSDEESKGKIEKDLDIRQILNEMESFLQQDIFVSFKLLIKS